MGETIRETVARAQELLWWSAVNNDDARRTPKEVQYPKSLGELCFEVAADVLAYEVVHGAPFQPRNPPSWPIVHLKIPYRDVKNLRRLLYHKHQLIWGDAFHDDADGLCVFHNLGSTRADTKCR